MAHYTDPKAYKVQCLEREVQRLRKDLCETQGLLSLTRKENELLREFRDGILRSVKEFETGRNRSTFMRRKMYPEEGDLMEFQGRTVRLLKKDFYGDGSMIKQVYDEEARHRFLIINH